ncbi:MAG: hypothetical protein JXJ20_00295 [Anaerolineae bacterium]|nr:hypothetical protein [Anaerolineae bacterium]
MARSGGARLAAGGLLLALCIGTPVSGIGAQSDGPALRFGVVDAWASPDDARDLGVSWERITFDWALFQPTGPDEFELDAVDPDWLEAADTADREITGLIVHTPAWASGSGQASAVPDGLDLPVGDPGNVWAGFITRLVETYAPLGVHHWIIYDEPDIRPGEGTVRFAGDVDDYARLLRTAYLAAAAADRRAHIHVAGMDWWGDVAAGREPYLARLVRVLQADPGAAVHGYYFDAVTLHVYTDTAAIWDMTTAARAILETAALGDKPIWLITNASPTLDPAVNAANALLGVTPDQQADFVMQAAAYSLAAGIERITIDRLVDAPGDGPAWGLVRADGSRRPAFDAYRTAIELFALPSAVTHYQHPDAELIRLDQGDQVVYVMWARGTTPVRFLFSSPQDGERAMLYAADGRAWVVRSRMPDFPPKFYIDLDAAKPDANGFLTVGGSPRVLVLDPADDFFRVIYVVVDGMYTRLH